MILSNKKLTISLDAMGGDYAPSSVICGISNIKNSLEQNVEFLLFGNEKIISPLVNKYNLSNLVNIVHTEKFIRSDEKPSHALRSGKGSSMWLAVESVKSGKSHAIISSGNTGALMVISKIQLRTLQHIHRPAICTIMPTINKKVVMLDLGANSMCDAENLMQFAIMGNAFAKILLKIYSPKIGLLNIGSESGKGNDIVNDAFQLINNRKDLNFYGYIEGNDISSGLVDVVVTDGFTGNVALKTAEGTAKLCKYFLNQSFRSSIIARIGYLLSYFALKHNMQKLDHRYYNGAMLVGLNGVVVKSHGSSDAIGFANAIKVTIELINQKINEKITNELENSDVGMK